MKKYLLMILVAVVVYCTGCKKNSSSVTPVSDSYFPVTSGFTWRYLDFTQDGKTDTITVKMTGGTSVINNKTYYIVSTKSASGGSAPEYFYAANHIYATRFSNAYAGTTTELKLFNDTVAVGNNLISSPTDNGLIDSIPARTVNKVIEKNITKTINGKTFTDVIHTEVDFQYDFNGSYETTFYYNFYLAKGIGIIESQLTILGSVYEEKVILDYTAK